MSFRQQSVMAFSSKQPGDPDWWRHQGYWVRVLCACVGCTQVDSGEGKVGRLVRHVPRVEQAWTGCAAESAPDTVMCLSHMVIRACWIQGPGGRGRVLSGCYTRRIPGSNVGLFRA